MKVSFAILKHSVCMDKLRIKKLSVIIKKKLIAYANYYMSLKSRADS